MTTDTLMRELRELGRVDVPQDSLERVWKRVLAAHPADAAHPRSVSPAGITGHAPPSDPGLRAGTSLPGLRPVSPPVTAPAPVLPAGVGSPSGVFHA